MKKHLLLLAVCTLILSGCKSDDYEKIELETTIAETMAPETSTAAPTTEAQTTEATKEETETTAQAPSISTTINTYESGSISIEYPSILHLDNDETTKKVDALLKENALSIISAYDLDEDVDSLEITCDIVSVDRNRITVIYEGSLLYKDGAYPQAIFFTNAIDLASVTNIRFSKYADPYTMAGYVLSDDCLFVAEPEVTSYLMEIKNDTTIQEYTKLFNTADFSDSGEFPSSFSYEEDGVFYFSIPVAHALGDYALITYQLEGK